MIYEGGNEYADLVKNITGIHKQTKVSVPGNQIFVKFETSSKVSKKGFRAYIHRIGKFRLFLHLFPGVIFYCICCVLALCISN